MIKKLFCVQDYTFVTNNNFHALSNIKTIHTDHTDVKKALNKRSYIILLLFKTQI